jgi:hypothetical protein
VVAEHRAHLERMLAELHTIRAMLEGDATLALPRIVADWGDHLYGNELAALDQITAALAGLGAPAPSGRVTVPPGTVRPLPGQD